MRLVVAAAFLFSCAAFPPAVTAQSSALSFADLARLPELQPGKELIITFAVRENGAPETFIADFVGVDAEAIRVSMTTDLAGRGSDLLIEQPVGGDRRSFAEPARTVVEIPRRRVVRIATADSIANGGAIGATVGAVPAALYAISICSDGGCDASAVGPTLAGMVAGAGIGLGIGLLVDYAHKREGKVLYESPAAAAAVALTFAPIVSGGRKGAAFVIRW